MFFIAWMICIGMAIFFVTEKKVAATIVWVILAFIPILNIVLALFGLIYLLAKALKGK